MGLLAVPLRKARPRATVLVSRTRSAKSRSSSPLGEGGSRQSRQACAPSAAARVASADCAARRSRRSPASASPTTPSSNAAMPPVSPTLSSRRSHAPCNWTTRSVPICSTSCARSNPFRGRAAAAARRKLSGPAFSGCSTGSTPRRRPQGPYGHPRDEQARRGALLGDAREPAPPCELGTVLLPRPTRDDVLRRLGRVRRRIRRRPARGSRTQPSRPGSNEFDRRAVDAERGVPRPLARHDVGTHDTGIKRLHHPLVGRLELTYEGTTLAADPDLVMFAFTAEVGSKSEAALNVLASWTATPDQQF